MLFSLKATLALTVGALLVLPGLAAEHEQSFVPTLLEQKTDSNTGLITQKWRSGTSNSTLDRIIISGDPSTVSPPDAECFHDFVGTKSLRKRAWRSQAHAKVYPPDDLVIRGGSELYWTFTYKNDNDRTLSLAAVAPGTHGIEWQTVNDGGCWATTCFIVKARYWENARGARPYYLRSEHEWQFWNGGKAPRGCWCKQDCSKCDPN